MSPDDWLLSLSELSGRNMEIWICSVTPHWRCAAITEAIANGKNGKWGQMAHVIQRGSKIYLTMHAVGYLFFKLNDILLRHC